LKTKGKHIHRGELLRDVIQNSDLTITQVVKKAGYSRGSYYLHIQDPSLPFDILEKYGRALHYDFTNDLPQMPKYLVDDGFQKRFQPKTFEEALEDRDYRRDKYIALLERYNALMERQKRGM